MNSSSFDQPTCSKYDDALPYILFCLVGIAIVLIVFLLGVLFGPSIDCCKKSTKKEDNNSYFSVAAATNVFQICRINASDSEIQVYNNPPIVLEHTVQKFAIINTWQSDTDNNCVRFITQSLPRFKQETEKLKKDGIHFYHSINGMFYSSVCDKIILIRINEQIEDCLEESNKKALGTQSNYAGNTYNYYGYAHYFILVHIYRCNPAQYKALNQILLASKA